MSHVDPVQTYLRHARHDEGLTIAELGERADLSTRTIWAAENGHNVNFSTQRKILAALQINWDQRTSYFSGVRALLTTTDSAKRAVR